MQTSHHYEDPVTEAHLLVISILDPILGHDLTPGHPASIMNRIMRVVMLVVQQYEKKKCVDKSTLQSCMILVSHHKIDSFEKSPRRHIASPCRESKSAASKSVKENETCEEKRAVFFQIFQLLSAVKSLLIHRPSIPSTSVENVENSHVPSYRPPS